MLKHRQAKRSKRQRARRRDHASGVAAVAAFGQRQRAAAATARKFAKQRGLEQSARRLALELV